MPETALRKLSMVSHHLGRRIRLEDAARAFVDRIVEKAKSELCLTLGDGWVYLFAFGSVVFIDVEAPKAEVFTQDLATYVEGQTEHLSDDVNVIIDPNGKDKVHFDRIVLQEVNQQKLRLLSLVLAQSTTLEHFEKQVEELLDRAAAFTDAIASGNTMRHTVKEMMGFLGTGLATRRQIVSNLAILDSPDIVWEDPALDTIFQEHKANFELTSRYRTLEHKLRLIHESVEVLVDISNTRQTHVLEIVVVLLIAVEVILAFIGHGR
ncbi:RMD1 family protein [bacterium]|nr:RMD1 family protein [bacterium]